MPALVAKTVGAGKCVLLNFVVPKDASWTDALVTDLLALAGVEPLVRVETADGTRPLLDFGCFRSGDALYAGFAIRGKGGMRADEQDVAAKLRFPRKGHIYDVVNSKYIGPGRELETAFTPATGYVYALLPNKRDKIELTVSRQTVSCGETQEVLLQTSAAGPETGVQIMRISVTGSKNEPRPAYARRIIVRNGQRKFRLPIALNDLLIPGVNAGTWTVRVQDAATGVAAETKFQVVAQSDR